MDVGEKRKLDSEKRSGDSVSYHSTNFVNSSMGMVLDGNPLVDSYGVAVWEHSANPQPLRFNRINAHSSVNPPDAGWQEANLVLKCGPLLPIVSGNIPHLSHLPADSAFIERAARFSSFNCGNIVDLMNSFAMNQPVNPCNQLTSVPHGSHEGFMATAIRAVSSGEPQENRMNLPSTSKDVSLSAEHKRQEKSPRMKIAICSDEAKQAESDESESGGGSGQEEPSLMDTGTEPSLCKRSGPKRRKMGGQDTEPEQSRQLSGEDANDNGKKSSPPSTVKTTGKNCKQNSPGSDLPKEEYIHVRARRGQATNSHSLAERVRREKISERMKFLQDLVPGCSKVTGKAVMLDEIINYVQSLQRQVEFLSMKLATVDPRLDFNINNLLAKDQTFATQAGPLSSLGFSPNTPMAYPPMHPSQPTLIQPSLPLIGNSSDGLRNLNPQLTSINEGYKEPTEQMPSVWDDELHSVVQMGFNPGASLDNQVSNSSLPDGHMKAEL